VLRRTDALRAALVSAVAHDLRSPLGSIQVAASSLLSPRVSWSPADQREFAQTIVDRVAYINRLITNLLAEGRIEAGKLRPQKEPAAIGEITARVIERLESSLAQHPVTLAIPADLPLVPLDVVEIDEALTNLLENAAKYTPPGTPITVRAEPRDAALVMDVADAGPGIPAEQLPRLFERYYRLEPQRTRGSGLGLAIARGIIEAHGGYITVSSRTTPPTGTTFTLTLPLPAAQSTGAATLERVHR
jgi:two-component system sensor histidine kinase KdpD